MFISETVALKCNIHCLCNADKPQKIGAVHFLAYFFACGSGGRDSTNGTTQCILLFFFNFFIFARFKPINYTEPANMDLKNN